MELRLLYRRIGVLLCCAGAAILSALPAIISQSPKAQTEAAAPSVHTLIIDPGHGGEDGGAVAADGTQEADVNLQIALRLNALSGLCGVPTVMTRDSAHIAYPTDAETIAARKKADQRQRAELIAATDHGVLLSIHQNFYPAAAPHGAQTLYAKSADSKEFGELLHSLLLRSLDPENRRVAAPIAEDIYLLRDIGCPAVLVECGFLSNAAELENLKNEAYDQKLALVMLSAYLQYFTHETGWST